MRLEGRARELVEKQLVAASERLVAAERQLADTECELEELGVAAEESSWIVRAMRNFGRVWQLMTPENRGRLFRVLIAEVRVDEAKNLVEVELVNFAGEPTTEEAA